MMDLAHSNQSTQAGERGPGRSHGHHGDRVTVAIVDDHAVVRDGLARLVADQGDLELIGVADSAAACRQLLAKTHPKVLIADINLGSESIFRTLRELEGDASSMHVLLLTGYPTMEHLEQAHTAGVMGFVAKTDDTSTVLDAVRSVARGERYLSSTLLAIPATTQVGSKLQAFRLSRREIEILGCIGHGLARQAIAKSLHISVRTVDRHRQNIMDKLDMHREAELVRFALMQGFCQDDKNATNSFSSSSLI